MTHKLYLFEPGREGRSWAIGHMDFAAGRVTQSVIAARHLAAWRMALEQGIRELDRLSAMAPASSPKAEPDGEMERAMPPRVEAGTRLMDTGGDQDL